MTYPRLNHAVASYGHYLIISGGHTLDNMVPKQVPESICFDIVSDERKEYVTEYLGSNKLGLGIAMVGDENILDELSSSWSFKFNSTTSFSTEEPLGVSSS